LTLKFKGLVVLIFQKQMAEWIAGTRLFAFGHVIRNFGDHPQNWKCGQPNQLLQKHEQCNRPQKVGNPRMHQKEKHQAKANQWQANGSTD
jgi:hypothetical protein